MAPLMSRSLLYTSSNTIEIKTQFLFFGQMQFYIEEPFKEGLTALHYNITIDP